MADELITIGADFAFDHPCVAVVRAGKRVINCIRLYPESYEHFKCEVGRLAEKWGAAHAYISAPPEQIKFR